MNPIRRLHLSICATALCAALAPGQSARSIPEIVGGDIGCAFGDAAGYFTAPLSFDGTDWRRAAAGTGAVAAFMTVDEGLNRFMTSEGVPGFLEEPLEWGKEWGELRTMEYASLGIYFTGLFSGSDDIRITGRLMGEALVLAGLPAITLQYGLGRSRPVSGRGAWDYRFFEWKNENQSLPSGHTTVAFAISTVLSKRIGRIWATIPLYTAAGLTALSLGWADQHWPSDLVIGMALGYLAGSYVVSREEERSGGEAANGRPGVHGGAGNRGRFEAGIGAGGLTVRYVLY